jgi:hypothetical protein
MRLVNVRSSLVERSAGIVRKKEDDIPNKTFIQLLKKNVGPKRYKRTKRREHNNGNKSKK